MVNRKWTWLVAFSGFLLMAGSLVAQSVDATVTVERTDSLFVLLSRGGLVMIPLALCSIVCVTLALERFISLSRKTVIPPALDDELQKVLDGRAKDKVKQAKAILDEHPSPLAEMYRVAVDYWDMSTEPVEKGMGESASLAVRRMRRSIRPLRLIAGISPLLGLLGTVIGMIRAFQTVALSSQSINKAELLAEGIYQAMVTTATGLTIAIPTLLVYFYFNNRIDKLSEEYEEKGNKFLNRYFRSRLKLES